METKPTIETVLEKLNAIERQFNERIDGLTGRVDGLAGRLDDLTDQFNAERQANQAFRIEMLDFKGKTLRELRQLNRSFESIAGENVVLRGRISDVEKRMDDFETEMETRNLRG